MLWKINTTGCDGLPESPQDTCMNDDGESQKETTDRKMEVFSTKTKTRIGFRNVRMMHETGKLAQITVEIRCFGGGGVLPIMAYTGRLRPKGITFSGLRYKKG